MTAPTAPSMPWRRPAALGLFLPIALGVILLFASWWGSSGTVDVGEQLPWLNLGVIGLIVMGSAQAMWLLVGRRAVGERQRRLSARLTEGLMARHGGRDALTSAIQPVATESMTRYHRPDCHLAFGKIVVAAPVDAHRKAGREPCPVCDP